MPTLNSSHAEDIGGRLVEPGSSFEESDADPQVLERLRAEGKVIDDPRPERSKKGDG